MLNFFQPKSGKFILLLVGVFALGACSRLVTPDQTTEITEVRAGQYALDPNHAALMFKLNHLGFSTFLGRFTEFDASLDFDPENIENANLEMVIEMSSINVNLEDFEEELRSDNFLDVAQYPQAVYRTTSFVEAMDDDTFVFAGDLSFHGVTAPVNITVNFNGGGRNFLTRSYTVGFSGSARFNRSDFGVDRFTSFGVGDEIELEVHVEFMDTGGES